MPILPLTLDPDPILHTRIAKADLDNLPTLQILVADMRGTMVVAQGIGLAANQVGKNIQLFTIDKGLAQKAGVSDVFINPEVIEVSEKTSIMEEGCLSLPGKFDEVRRPSEITVRALDEEGKQFSVKATGLLARVLQHEIDHLNGFLFINRVEH